MTIGMKAFLVSMLCALTLGAFSTLGDWLWASYIPDGAVLPGVVHGMSIFLILASVLGAAAQSRRATKRLLLSLPLAGVAIAGAFYPLASWIGYLAALLFSWTLMWIALATLQRWARDSRESMPRTLLRAGVAALGSGLAFWTISDIWTQSSPDPNYWLRLVYWTWAFLPGFTALLVGHARDDA